MNANSTSPSPGGVKTSGAVAVGTVVGFLVLKPSCDGCFVRAKEKEK